MLQLDNRKLKKADLRLVDQLLFYENLSIIPMTKINNTAHGKI